MHLQHLLNTTEQEQPMLDVQHYLKTEDDMILETGSGRKFYNMDLEVIEERLWNGYYCTPRQFVDDLHLILLDAVNSGERDRIIKAQEMYTNIQVQFDDVQSAAEQQLLLEYDRLLERETARQKERLSLPIQPKIEKPVENEPTSLTGLEVPSNSIEINDDTSAINVAEKANERQTDVRRVSIEEMLLVPADSIQDAMLVNVSSIQGCTILPTTDAENSRLNNSSEETANTKDIVYMEGNNASDNDISCDQNSTSIVAIYDGVYVEDIYNAMVEKSDHLTIDQLEQVNAVCTCEVWNGRYEVDRNALANNAWAIFLQTITNIKPYKK